MKTKKIKIFTSMVALLVPNISFSAAVQFEIIDVYSSVDVSYELGDGSISDSVYYEAHGASNSELQVDYDLGLMTGSQNGRISASENDGRVHAVGDSYTNILEPDISGGFYEESSFLAWGKHVVLGSFVVPNTGTLYTDIYLDVSFNSSDNGQALFRMESEDSWNPTNYLPSDYIPWGGVNNDRLFEFLFEPGELVYFAFGIEPGIGRSGDYRDGLIDSDSVDVVFELQSNTPLSEVPLPAAAWLFGSGLLGLIGFARYRK